jgi:hypothetical protein
MYTTSSGTYMNERRPASGRHALLPQPLNGLIERVWNIPKCKYLLF